MSKTYDAFGTFTFHVRHRIVAQNKAEAAKKLEALARLTHSTAKLVREPIITIVTTED